MTRQLWAPWRLEYIGEAGTQDGCVFCMEAAGELGEHSLAVHRGERGFVLLNKFPYASGHLMVASTRHVAELSDLTSEEAAELHDLTTQAIDALRAVYAPHAFNVGWNLGHRILKVSNDSSGGSSISILTHAARTSIDAGDKVASVSYSGVQSSGVDTTGGYIRQHGGLLVWAAGNEGATGGADDA